ncbi:hypothetical protein [Nocardia sp. NPDC050406]|uniref:hypothetical protein n=1 Tax=Nocardia sp. NPDC050406 TaxID=3364318 RepID=UPI0037B0D24D
MSSPHQTGTPDSNIPHYYPDQGPTLLDPYGGGTVPNPSASHHATAAPTRSPRRPDGMLRVTGGLLLGVAGSVAIAAFVQLAGFGAGGTGWWAWQRGNEDTGYEPRMVGVAFILSAVIAALAGALLLMGRGVNSRGVRSLGALASGIAAGFALTEVLDLITITQGFPNFDLAEYLNAGFWLLVVAALLSLVTMVTSVVATGRNLPLDAPQSAMPNRRGPDAAAAVFLIVATVLAVGGSFLDIDDFALSNLWHNYDHSDGTTPLMGIFLVLVGLTALTVSMLLIAGTARRWPQVRTAGPMAAGLMFGTILTSVLAAIPPYFLDSDFAKEQLLTELEVGAWVLLAAVVVSLGAVVVSLATNREAGRTPTFPPPNTPAFAPPIAGPYATPSAAAAPGNSPSPTAGLRMARVYDSRNDAGQPVVERPPLDPKLRDALLAYLESAPLVLAARSMDQDEFAPGERDVPLSYFTDGVWIWSGAVPHYLIKHGVPPEPELVRHVVARNFRLEMIDDRTRELAVRTITGT